jgi:hypothetical protein
MRRQFTGLIGCVTYPANALFTAKTRLAAAQEKRRLFTRHETANVAGSKKITFPRTICNEPVTQA